MPESERHWLFHAIEPQFDFGTARRAQIGDLGQLSAEEAASRMYTYGQELIAAKRAAPSDNMLSVVANASVDDGALSDLELYLFEELLSRFSSATLVKPVEWTRSNRHTGIRHLVVELR